MQYKRSRKIVENLNGVFPFYFKNAIYEKKHQDIKEHLITQKRFKKVYLTVQLAIKMLKRYI